MAIAARKSVRVSLKEADAITFMKSKNDTRHRQANSCGSITRGDSKVDQLSGKLSATRREDESWSIDGAELARYIEVNGHRFQPETGSGKQPKTPDIRLLPGAMSFASTQCPAPLAVAQKDQLLCDSGNSESPPSSSMIARCWRTVMACSTVSLVSVRRM